MTEADLLSQVAAVGSSLWSVMQYWTSVSIGILIGSYFVANRLNVIFLTLFILIYILFSVQTAVVMRLQTHEMQAIAMDLINIADSGIVLSNTARTFLEGSPVVNKTLAGQISRLLVFFTMFLVTIIYPFYCRRTSVS
jgi:hypothetical protein